MTVRGPLIQPAKRYGFAPAQCRDGLPLCSMYPLVFSLVMALVALATPTLAQSTSPGTSAPITITKAASRTTIDGDLSEVARVSIPPTYNDAPVLGRPLQSTRIRRSLRDVVDTVPAQAFCEPRLLRSSVHTESSPEAAILVVQ
jgi:hypothetical protein